MCWVNVQECYYYTLVILPALWLWKVPSFFQPITKLLKWKYYSLGSPLLTARVFWVWPREKVAKVGTLENLPLTYRCLYSDKVDIAAQFGPA